MWSQTIVPRGHQRIGREHEQVRPTMKTVVAQESTTLNPMLECSRVTSSDGEVVDLFCNLADILCLTIDISLLGGELDSMRPFEKKLGVYQVRTGGVSAHSWLSRKSFDVREIRLSTPRRLSQPLGTRTPPSRNKSHTFGRLGSC